MRVPVLAFLAGLAASLVCGTTLAADEPGLSASDRGAIETVISRQLDAFRRDDGAAAFAFASPSIQEMFRTPDAFMAMVRRSYRPVYRPRDVRFEALLQHRGQLMQRVVFVGPEQEVVIALYEMQRQPNGEWRINGCFLLPAPERAT